MRGMSGFGHHPGMRQLPRPGKAGGSLEFVSVPGLPGRRSRAGSGHGGTDARACVGRGVRTAVPCFVTVREMLGRTTSPCGCTALRPAARSFRAPQRRLLAAFSRTVLPALQSAVVGVQPTTFLAPRPGAQARRRRSAATPCTYGAQASSLARSVPRCEASGLVTTPGPETGYRRNVLIYNVGFGFRLTLNRQHGQVPSGVRPLPGHFFAGMSTSIRCAPPTGEALDWGAALRAGGTLVSGVL